MIKANELRVGNIILYQRNGITTETVRLIGIMDDSLIHLEGNQDGACYSHSLKDYSGIPLTPEILDKCGFNPFFHNFEKSIKISYSLIDSRAYIGNSTSTSGTSVLDIKYLHQLQNLIFALTGEELEINL